MDLLAQDSSTAASVSSTGEKVCRVCAERKHVTEFVVSRADRSKDGRKNICKPCQRVKNAEYAKRNPNLYAERHAKRKEEFERYGVDEKYGDTWQALDAALSMCRRTIPLQRAA